MKGSRTPTDRASWETGKPVPNKLKQNAMSSGGVHRQFLLTSLLVIFPNVFYISTQIQSIQKSTKIYFTRNACEFYL